MTTPRSDTNDSGSPRECRSSNAGCPLQCLWTCLEHMGTASIVSILSSAGGRYNAGVSLYSAHTGPIDGPLLLLLHA